MQSDVVKDALILAALAGVAAACFKLVGLSSVVIQYLRVSKPVINGVISGVGTGRRFINGLFAATSMVTSFPAAVLGIKRRRRKDNCNAMERVSNAHDDDSQLAK